MRSLNSDQQQIKGRQDDDVKDVYAGVYHLFSDKVSQNNTIYILVNAKNAGVGEKGGRVG